MLDPASCIAAPRDGFRAPASPIAGQRVRTDLPFPGTATALIPGVLPGIEAYTVKANAKFPGARPALCGVVCLHSGHDGRLLALMDSATITAWRTGLAAALGTDLQAGPGSVDGSAVGVIGAGAQAELMVQGLTALRRHREIVVHDADPDRAKAFASRHDSQVAALETGHDYLRVVLADGTGIDSRAVLIATGARHRRLPLASWERFEGYAATNLEAQLCAGQPVCVVGGANSAGRAALYLTSHGCGVMLAVRGENVASGMSTYLLDRLRADPRVTVRPSTEVTELHGGEGLERIALNNRASGKSAEQPCRGLFCFIGASAATDWLPGLSTDPHGFLRTDVQLDPHPHSPVWAALSRSPLPFEAGEPGVFAVGDVRSGSMKRVAAAVGEGAGAVHSVHAAIGTPV